MKKLVSVLAALALGTFSFAEAEFSGGISTVLGMAFPYTKNAWNFVQGLTTLDGKVSFWQGSSRLYADGSLSFDALRAASSEKKLDFVSGIHSFSGKLKEAYFDYDGSWWGLRVGRQLETWGAADSLSVTNVLCPKDLTSISGTDVSENYIGIDAVKLNFTAGFFSANLYWIPFFTPSPLPLDSGNVLNRLLMPKTVELGHPVGSLPINPFSNENIEMPELSLKSGEYAIKAAFYTKFADFSLYGFYGWEDSPLSQYEVKVKTVDMGGGVKKTVPDAISMHGSYRRMAMIGFDTSLPLGDFVLRLEGAYFPERYFATSPDYQIKTQIVHISTTNSVSGLKYDLFQKRHQLVSLFGFDWIKGDWAVTAQYYADVLLGNAENLDRNVFSHKTSFSASYSMLGGTLSLSLSGIVALNDLDLVVETSAKYSLTDQIKLMLGAYVFSPGPKSDGTYGKYKDISGLVIKGEFNF